MGCLSGLCVAQTAFYVAQKIVVGMKTGYPRNVGDDWMLPDEFEACGSVTAAIALSSRQLLLFCDTLYAYVDTTNAPSAQTIIDWDGGQWVSVTAAYNWPGSPTVHLCRPCRCHCHPYGRACS